MALAVARAFYGQLLRAVTTLGFEVSDEYQIANQHDCGKDRNFSQRSLLGAAIDLPEERLLLGISNLCALRGVDRV